MYFCPRCHEPLIQNATANGVFWQCAACQGQAMGFGVLRKTIGPQRMAEVVGQAVTASNRDGCDCPMCSRAMTIATLELEDQTITLDLCQSCGFIWFDAAEYEAIPSGPPPPHVLGEINPSKMTPEAREKLAMAEVKRIADEARAQDASPDEDWKSLPAIFGMPVELDAPPLLRTPWATCLLSLIIAVVSLAAFPHLDSIIDQFGLIPEECWRDHGLTLITSFFLHAGFLHLFGNLYFLMVFGRSVENDLGPWRWLLLVLAADQTGNFLHILGNYHAMTPCIGASGGISGLLAYYALRFPKMRLGMLFYWRWIQFPASFAFVLWVLLQIYGAISQHYGLSNVASLAHLGGVIPGILFWLIWRKRLTPTTDSGTINPIQVKIE
jgi:membrane associated rhomboid family serine protease